MSDPEPTPAEEEVRRLLADARHDEPMPADVAARLDGVLADLHDETRRTSAPVDLAARRRRRVARNMLVAAAAVVVLGVGVSRIDLSGQDEDGGSADSSAGSALKESAPDDEAGGGASGDRLRITGRPLVLSSDDFDEQVRRLQSSRGSAALSELSKGLADGAYPDSDGYSGDLDARARTWCGDPAGGTGRRIAVRYDGERGVLVLRPPADGSRVVDLYLCGESLPTRTVALPAG